MRERGLGCKQKNGFVVHTTDSSHPYPIYPNRIKDLIVTRLNQVWIGDITYVRMLRGFAYLAALLDKLSRKVIGYAVSRMINPALTLDALKMAVEKRRPAPGCIHHSDRVFNMRRMNTWIISRGMASRSACQPKAIRMITRWPRVS